MKKMFKSILGVTLLEILLVLVIASLVLVMSIRYYQTASQSSKVNVGMETLSGIIGAVDSYVNAGNTMASITSATIIQNYLPNNQPIPSPWGTGNITVVGAANSYNITYPSTPFDACTKFAALATQNRKITQVGSCPGSGAADLVFTVTP